jgi:PPM family protein phosphatase
MQLWSHTDIGNGRSENQDSVYANAELGLLILADGMGGQNGGEVASQRAVFGTAEMLEDILAQTPPASADAMAAAIDAIIAVQNRKLFEQAEADPRLSGMGCTLVVVVIHGGRATIANVGDSRCYHYRGGTVVQVTKDHSLVQAQIDSGILTEEEAEHASIRNVLMRAVGVADTVAVDFFHLDLQPGDVLMTCSDGLMQPYPSQALNALILSSVQQADPARYLVDQAVAAGTSDNVSVQVVAV